MLRSLAARLSGRAQSRQLSLPTGRGFSSTATAVQASSSSTASTASNELRGADTADTEETVLFDGSVEVLTREEADEKKRLIAELTKKLAGPLADEQGRIPTKLEDRPIVIEVDGPWHFYNTSVLNSENEIRPSPSESIVSISCSTSLSAGAIPLASCTHLRTSMRPNESSPLVETCENIARNFDTLSAF